MTEQQNQDPTGPPPAGPPPASQPPVNWAAAAPPQATVPGTAGLVYADVPNRIIALIIDVIILAVINFVVALLLASFVDVTGFVGALVYLIVAVAISAAYWIYSWTRLRGSPGQKVLGMQVGNFPDGRTLTQDQAIRRWIALGGPFPIAQALSPLPAIGAIIGLIAFIYTLYLLWTTAQSPTKRGFHDIFAGSVVVKAARSV